ncbi:hypothetical protein CR513_08873, partial [Mucuna pruriens]
CGISAVLLQEIGPIAYFSRALFAQTLLKSTYEKEMMALESRVTDAISRMVEDGELLALTRPIWLDVEKLKQEVKTYPSLSRIVAALQKDLNEFHATIVGGHFGAYRTYKKLEANLYWRRMMTTLQGTTLSTHTTYHPEIDGQTVKLESKRSQPD